VSPPSKTGRGVRKAADVDQLIDEILVDAYGDDEQLWAFRQASRTTSQCRVTGSWWGSRCPSSGSTTTGTRGEG
jgi:hypothetical protein